MSSGLPEDTRLKRRAPPPECELRKGSEVSGLAGLSAAELEDLLARSASLRTTDTRRCMESAALTGVCSPPGVGSARPGGAMRGEAEWEAMTVGAARRGGADPRDGEALRNTAAGWRAVEVEGAGGTEIRGEVTVERRGLGLE